MLRLLLKVPDRIIMGRLESVLKPAECRIGTDFSVGQGDLTRESWRISSQINAVPAEKGALRRRFDGFKTDSKASPPAEQPLCLEKCGL